LCMSIDSSPLIRRFTANSLSCLLSCLASSLAAINFDIVNASYVGLQQSGVVLLAAYIGGTGYFIGPVLGAILVTYLQIMLSDVTEIWQLYFGLLFIAVVMFAPGGLAGLLMMHAPLLRARADRAHASSAGEGGRGNGNAAVRRRGQRRGPVIVAGRRRARRARRRPRPRGLARVRAGVERRHGERAGTNGSAAMSAPALE